MNVDNHNIQFYFAHFKMAENIGIEPNTKAGFGTHNGI